MNLNRLAAALLLTNIMSGCTIDRSLVIDSSETPRAIRLIDGDVDLAVNARAKNIRVIDGNIRLDENSRVEKNIRLIDGTLEIGPRASVQKDVITHHATVKMEGAVLFGDMDAFCTGGELINTRIHGTLIIRKKALWYLRCDPKRRLVIGPGTEIGTLVIKSTDVDIEISDKARVNEIIKKIEPSRDTAS